METLKERLKRIITQRGYKIISKSEISGRIVIDFIDESIFERLKREGKNITEAYYYSTSSCQIEKDGKIECNIISPIRKHLEFVITCGEEFFRPHFIPEDKVFGFEIRTRNLEKIAEILDSISVAK